MSPINVALAGNPNTGKSTLFNRLTGLRQHTGNWPGKTVRHAEGRFVYHEHDFQVVDLPGTYSLHSNSADEEVARDFIVFEKPDVTVVVLDATALQRNLNVALQVLEMTDRVVLCLNLMDEADEKGIQIDERQLSQKLGVPVHKISARNKTGIDAFLDTLVRVAKGELQTDPYTIRYSDELEQKIGELEPDIRAWIGEQYPARWIALRLLDGDETLLKSLKERMLWEKPEVKPNESFIRSSL